MLTLKMQNFIKKRILIIGNDIYTAKILWPLIEQCGYEVEVIMYILSLSDILKLQPHLIILDPNTTNGLGGMLCRRLKHAESTKHIPLIMIGASQDIANAVKEYGANEFISKPFDRDEIDVKIGELLK